MLDIGVQELVIIFVVALLVIGPDKLPEFSLKLGKWVNEIKRGVHEAKARMEDEFDEKDKIPEETIKSDTEEKAVGANTEAGIKEGKP